MPFDWEDVIVNVAISSVSCVPDEQGVSKEESLALEEVVGSLARGACSRLARLGKPKESLENREGEMFLFKLLNDNEECKDIFSK